MYSFLSFESNVNQSDTGQTFQAYMFHFVEDNIADFRNIQAQFIRIQSTMHMG